MSDLPDSMPPAFYRRVYTEHTTMDEVTMVKRQPDGTVLIVAGVAREHLPPDVREAESVPLVEPGTSLVIYGRGVTPRSADDRQYVRDASARGLIFGEWYSTACLDGEVGSHPLATLTDISREEFEAARARGWA